MEPLCPPTAERDFQPRHNLDASDLVELFHWTETQFLERTAGSPIRRAGYANWWRNIAVALGNTPTSNEVITALQKHRDDCSALVREHIEWALAQHLREVTI